MPFTPNPGLGPVIVPGEQHRLLEVSNSTIQQNETHTTLVFTRPLTPKSEYRNDDNTIGVVEMTFTKSLLLLLEEDVSNGVARII